MQSKVEKKWNVYHRNRHNNIYLYDITSSYFEGTENALSAFGYNMKTDKLNIRPIFHINVAQTRGRVFVCMFSYAIAKEIETAIYPWIKTFNKEDNCQLSNHNIMDELDNIKVGELEIGHKLKKILVPELNAIQGGNGKVV